MFTKEGLEALALEGKEIVTLFVSTKITAVETFEFFVAAKCIDHYTKLRVENRELPDVEEKPIDPRLEGIVNKMFQRCFDDHKYKQAIGIALETRRLDVFEKVILESVSNTTLVLMKCCSFLFLCYLISFIELITAF